MEQKVIPVGEHLFKTLTISITSSKHYHMVSSTVHEKLPVLWNMSLTLKSHAAAIDYRLHF